MVSSGFQKLCWISPAADHQTINIHFCWRSFYIARRPGVSSWSSHWADFHFSPQVTIGSRKESFLATTKGKNHLKTTIFLFSFSSCGISTYKTFWTFQFASNAVLQLKRERWVLLNCCPWIYQNLLLIIVNFEWTTAVELTFEASISQPKLLIPTLYRIFVHALIAQQCL